MKKTLLMAAILLLSTSMAYAQLGTTTPTGVLSVAVSAEAGLTVDTATTSLTSLGTNFSPYTGTTNLTYYIRTTKVGGSGTIVLEVTTDFSPANGPSVGSPPTGTDQLTYTPAIDPPGTAAGANQVASTGSSTSVATFGANAHSTFAGLDATVAWTLTNDPLYETGTFTATITYTIAAV